VQIFPDFALAAPEGSVPGVNSRPATVGDILVFYATGVGPVDQQVANGDVPRVLTQFSPPITVLIGGVPAIPQFAGLSGSFVALNQINVAVPAGVPTGASVPLQIQSGGITTTDKITIAIQAPPAQVTLQSVTISPTSVTGGESATGTLTLSGSAPSGGVDVQVRLGFQVPVAIRVAGGRTSATFQINTVAVTSSTTLTITATLNGIQRTATLTVLPGASSNAFRDYYITMVGNLDARRENDFNDDHLGCAANHPSSLGGRLGRLEFWHFILLLLL